MVKLVAVSLNGTGERNSTVRRTHHTNKRRKHRHLTNPIQIVDGRCYLVNAGWGVKRHFNHAG